MFKYFFALVLIFLTLNLSAQEITDAERTKYNNIPATLVQTLKNKKIPFNSLFKKNTATVLMFFSPDCDHCEHELESIQKSYENLKTINFIMISNRPLSLLQPFYKKHKLSAYKSIQMYSDPKNLLARYYGIGGYPSMVIYTQRHTVSKKYVSMLVNYVGILKAAYPPLK